MKRIKFLFSAIVFSLSVYFFSCSNPPNIATTVTSTGRAECDSQISFFNRSSSYNVVKDIKKAQAAHRLTPEIIALYPAARDQWNEELKNFGRNYTRTYATSIPRLPTTVKSSNNMSGLESHQKFFLLLTEAAWGNYPKGSTNMENVQSWVISADISRSLDAVFRRFQNGDCINVDQYKIRALLNPHYLPDRIEDCYN